jgi:hypothetical protein
MEKKAKGYMEKRNCVDCGEEFIAKQVKAVRCPKCRKAYKIEQDKKYNKARYEKERAEIIAERKAMGLPLDLRACKRLKENKEEYDPNVCGKIKSCYYGGKMGAMHICDYLGITGVRRPCPAGDCVMYKRRRKK